MAPTDCPRTPPPPQPAVVAACTPRPESESLVARLTLPPGVSSTFHENDMVLLSRDNPEVGGSCSVWLSVGLLSVGLPRRCCARLFGKMQAAMLLPAFPHA